MVITFINSDLCRNACLVVTLPLKQYFSISPMQHVLAFIRHVGPLFLTFCLLSLYSSLAGFLKDPCGRMEYKHGIFDFFNHSQTTSHVLLTLFLCLLCAAVV